jgi:ribosomal protein S18 acetylase RimI-like enzyme
VTQRYEIHLFADDGRFQLQDDDDASPDAICVDAARHGEVAVTVELHDEFPDIDDARWKHVDSARLKIDSGRLVVASATEYFPEAFRIRMRRGEYAVLVCQGRAGYLVALYPAAAQPATAADVRVVRLDASHAGRYRDLMLRAYAQAPDAFTSTPEEREREPESWWVKRIADPAGSGVAFGGFAGEELVGTVALEFSAKPKTRHKAHLIGMFVAPEARGRGAARLLLEAALAFCRTRVEVTSVTLTVTQGNEPALALYRAAGFRAFGVEPMALRTAEGYLAKVHMQLAIDREV